MDDVAAPPGWLVVAALLFTALHWSMLVRDAKVQESDAAALAAGLTLLAMLIPAYQLAAQRAELTPGFWLAAASVALALRAGPGGRRAAGEWVYNAYIGGLLPIAAAYQLALRDAWEVGRVPVILAGVCVVLAVMLRWGRRLRPRVPEAAPTDAPVAHM